MTGLRFIDGLSEIASDYDALACDAWGVIHNGRALLPGAAEAMTRFRRERGPLVILTNAPKPSSIIPAQLARLGLPEGAWDSVVTSGDATRAEIQKRLPAPAYRIGPSFDDSLFEGLAIDFAPMAEAGFIICTGLNDGFEEEPEQYRALLTEAAARELVMVCANPDIKVNWGGKMMWCAGALAAIYEEAGGEVVYGGKPYPPIYRLVRDAIGEARGASADDARILAVGDGLDTDIRGANMAGLDALLVVGRGGLHEHDPGGARIAAALEQKDLRVLAATEGLKW